MPDYTQYTFDDLVHDPRFRQWALTDSPPDREFWNNWLQQNPDKLDLVLAARQFVIQMRQAHEELPDNELEQELIRLRVARQQLQDDDQRRPQWHLLRNLLRVAAVLILVGMGTFYYLRNHSAKTPLETYEQLAEQQAGPLREVSNETGKTQLIRLPDGSRVALQNGSRISYPVTFTTHQRDVFLVGEAFFDVVRRPKQPFMVYTNQLTTKVLGTSFTVRAYANDKEAKVIVRTGKVSVFTTPASGKPDAIDTKSPAVILTPNQEVTFDRDEKQLKRALVKEPEPLPSTTEQTQTMVFEHTPVVSVFKKLESTYGILINYDADLLTGCELTADFSNESLFERLDLICRATESRYEVIDAQIVIYSKGCRQPN
ncbi:FecR domain-containing protein [Spirosoma sp. SC4-14]|uniref:FecR family protein n=1 Tax=Spirosoma sp. SC4-14 TaxID=3128900 RepID=UPI0030D377D0